MDTEQLKALVGRAALQHLVPGTLVGVGTGSTVNHFIAALAGVRDRFAGAVSSSRRSTELLLAHGIPVFEPDAAFELLRGQGRERLPVYVDGADEIDPRGCMIKGGGAALTREKIVADLAERFVCIADQSKRVPMLGRFPLPVEVLPMALPRLVQRFAALGGEARLRGGVTTDNGLVLLDVHGLAIADPPALEDEISAWPGVLTAGIFARHRAHVALLGTPAGVETVVF